MPLASRSPNDNNGVRQYGAHGEAAGIEHARAAADIGRSATLLQTLLLPAVLFHDGQKFKWQTPSQGQVSTHVEELPRGVQFNMRLQLAQRFLCQLP